MERPKLQAVAKGGDLAGLGRWLAHLFGVAFRRVSDRKHVCSSRRYTGNHFVITICDAFYAWPLVLPPFFHPVTLSPPRLSPEQSSFLQASSPSLQARTLTAAVRECFRESVLFIGTQFSNLYHCTITGT